MLNENLEQFYFDPFSLPVNQFSKEKCPGKASTEETWKIAFPLRSSPRDPRHRPTGLTLTNDLKRPSESIPRIRLLLPRKKKGASRVGVTRQMDMRRDFERN